MPGNAVADAASTLRVGVEELARAAVGSVEAAIDPLECDRPPSWSDVHHVIPWEEFGETALRNCVMLCRFHHRLLHSGSGWVVQIRGGRAEFVPPKLVDRTQTARRKPHPPSTCAS